MYACPAARPARCWRLSSKPRSRRRAVCQEEPAVHEALPEEPDMRSEVKCQERQGSPGTSLASLDSPPEVVMRKMQARTTRGLLINTAGPFTQILQPSWVDMNIREGRPAIAVSGGVGSPEDSWIP